MQEKVNDIYPFKVWGCTVVLSPILLIIYMFLTSTSNGEIDLGAIIGFTFLADFLGATYSIPTFLVYYIAFLGCSRISFLNHWAKLLLSSLALFGMALTFYVMIGPSEFRPKSDINFLIPYAIGIICAGLYFPIKSKADELSST
jgi:hypothetical protein